MSFYLQDDFFSGVPHLLVSAGKQYLIVPGEAGRLQLQEGTGSIWQEPRTLPLCQDMFGAVLDKNRNPHLVIMEQGNFYHLPISKNNGEETPVPFYREERKQCRHFLMAGDRQGALHLIYPAVDHTAERWWLLHHRYIGGTWKEPRVIDSGPGVQGNRSVAALDERDCLHLFYQVNGAGLYYRQFDPGTAGWSKASPISSSPAAADPSLAVDRNRNLHLLWSSPVEGKYHLYYRFRGGPGWRSRGWTPETVISPAMVKRPFPFFSYQSGELFIAWLDRNTLFRYRFAGDRWDRIEEKIFEKPQLLRANSFGLEGIPLNYWLAVESGKKAAEHLHPAILAAVDYDDLESDFSRLHRYSEKLIGRIDDLATAGERLEGEVRSRNRDMLLLSRQGEQERRLLQESLERKETELKELQLDFTRIVDSLKKKIEQNRLAREAERKRFLDTRQECEMERRRLENRLQEKEKMISCLEARNREQIARIEQLHRDNKALQPKKSAERGRLKKFWKQLFPPE